MPRRGVWCADDDAGVYFFFARLAAGFRAVFVFGFRTAVLRADFLVEDFLAIAKYSTGG